MAIKHEFYCQFYEHTVNKSETNYYDECIAVGDSVKIRHHTPEDPTNYIEIYPYKDNFLDGRPIYKKIKNAILYVRNIDGDSVDIGFDLEDESSLGTVNINILKKV